MRKRPETTRLIYCCACKGEVMANLVHGRDVYPHRPDLFHLPFWRCPECFLFVGCHHKSADAHKPLGCIPTPEIKAIRKVIHAWLDPIWEQGYMSRGRLYKLLSARLGREYHTAELRTTEEAMMMQSFVKRLSVRLRS